jgi:AcrR family transcriptional regulator
MARDATVTRERLLRAGERLFAERGIDGVTVREINQLAGQRNSSALHYHFGSREGLLNEIRAQHREPIEERRVAMLDTLEREQRTDDLRALVETIVYPFAAELATDSGRDYLRILPQLTGRLRMPVGKIPPSFGPHGIRRTVRYAHRCFPEFEPTVREERLAVVMEFATNMIARRAQEIEVGVAFRFPEERFISNLVDMAVGSLVTPVGTSPRPSPR